MTTINELFDFCDKENVCLTITPCGEGHDRIFEIDLCSDGHHSIRWLPRKTVMVDISEQLTNTILRAMADIDRSKAAEAARKIKNDEILYVKRSVCRGCTYPGCEGIERCKLAQRGIKWRRKRNEQVEN